MVFEVAGIVVGIGGVVHRGHLESTSEILDLLQLFVYAAGVVNGVSAKTAANDVVVVVRNSGSLLV